MSNKRKVLSFAKCLDRMAEEIETNYGAYGITSEQAASFTASSDRLADYIMQTNGIDPKYFETQERESMVHERDEDEDHLDTFGNPAVIEWDADDTDTMSHMNDLNGDETRYPLEGDTVEAGCDDDMEEDEEEDDDKEASFTDYWNDSGREAQVDYWSDDYWK
jgi:hypothetical protein